MLTVFGFLAFPVAFPLFHDTRSEQEGRSRHNGVASYASYPIFSNLIQFANLPTYTGAHTGGVLERGAAMEGSPGAPLRKRRKMAGARSGNIKMVWSVER